MVYIANLFQFAFLSVRSLSNLIGREPIQDALIQNHMDTQFTINTKGDLEIKFEQLNQSTEKYYFSLLEVLAGLIQKAFGKEYTYNFLLKHYEKIKSWAEIPNEHEPIKQFLDKIEKGA